MHVKDCQEYEDKNVDLATRAGRFCQSLEDVWFGNRLLIEMIKDVDGSLQDVNVEGRTEGDPNHVIPNAFSYYETPSSRPTPFKSNTVVGYL